MRYSVGICEGIIGSSAKRTINKHTEGTGKWGTGRVSKRTPFRPSRATRNKTPIPGRPRAWVSSHHSSILGLSHLSFTLSTPALDFARHGTMGKPRMSSETRTVHLRSLIPTPNSHITRSTCPTPQIIQYNSMRYA